MRDLAADIAASYEQIIDRFVAWAAGEDTIPAAMIVGSRARTERPADAWSDLDLVIFADAPDTLLADERWPSRFGNPVISFLESTAVGGWRERRVLYDGAIDVDVAIVPTSDLEALVRAAEAGAVPRELADVVHRGVRILSDPSGDLQRLVTAATKTPLPAPDPPDQASFAQVVNDFWYHAVWIAKKLGRGELVVAHECLESNQRRLALSLLRWHASQQHPIWHGTRFLEAWADPTMQAMFADTWARHDRDDIIRANQAMMDLVSRLSDEIAAGVGLHVPSGVEDAARTWFAAILASPDTVRNTL